MDSKVIVFIIAVIILGALFLASPRGRDFLEKSKLNDKVKTLGNFFKNLTGKVTSVKKDDSSKIELTLSGVDPTYLNGIEFDIKDSEISIQGNVISGNMDAATLSFKDKVNFYTQNANGKITYTSDSLVISGKTSDFWIDNFGINKTDISFSLTSKPMQYKITNAESDYLEFKQVSGSLSWLGLKIPAVLQNDRLEIYNFDGEINYKNGLVYIKGYASYMKLNNVPIGIFK
ncbi:MAG: hypothetical protein QXM68_01320 [Candidatus Aenigmatarchaeota archaeon]|nr:hypothetical protein [Candidatus Aenigmarchaeota archaeon]